MHKILSNKRVEVKALKEAIDTDPEHPLRKFMATFVPQESNGKFLQAIKSDGLSVIAEIKRQSPSSGEIRPIQEPQTLAAKYIQGGASAISVLTDQQGFGGRHEDLTTIRKHYPKVPILRKDFIIDPLQIVETAYLGADAALLIVAVLGKQTGVYLKTCRLFGLDTLVEVHNEEELKIAIHAGADIIGVNNRNLNTFQTDTAVSIELVNQIPNGICKVSESGIHTPIEAAHMHHRGFDGVLIGEALVRSTDPELFIKQARSCAVHE